MTAPTRGKPRPTILVAEPKLEARRKAERRRRLRGWLRKIGFTLLALLPIVILSWVVLSSPLFDVDHVEVTGTTSPDLVEQAAAVEMGRPLALVDLDGVHDRVAALASVSAVKVSRDWPGSVRITVTERVPVAAIAVPKGGFRLIASDGTPYGTVRTRPPGVVSISVPAPGPSAQDPTTRATLAVLGEVGPAIRGKITSASAQSSQRVVLVVGRRVVVWGRPGDRPAEKTRAVQVLLTRPGGQIDVSAPGVATVTAPVP